MFKFWALLFTFLARRREAREQAVAFRSLLGRTGCDSFPESERDGCLGFGYGRPPERQNVQDKGYPPALNPLSITIEAVLQKDLEIPQIWPRSSTWTCNGSLLNPFKWPRVSLPRSMDTILPYLPCTQLHSSAGDTTELLRLPQKSRGTFRSIGTFLDASGAVSYTHLTLPTICSV